MLWVILLRFSLGNVSGELLIHAYNNVLHAVLSYYQAFDEFGTTMNMHSSRMTSSTCYLSSLGIS